MQIRLVQTRRRVTSNLAFWNTTAPIRLMFRPDLSAAYTSIEGVFLSLEDDLLEQRVKRAAEIEALGLRAYGQRFDFTHTIPEILAAESAKTAEELTAAKP